MTFPMVSQLTKITTDGQPSENAQDDCVAASICAAVMYLKGVTTVGGVYTPDNFKDRAAGQSYTGVTAPAQYVSFCASLGVHLYSFNGEPAQLIALTLVHLAKGHPVVFTEPDPYAPGKNWTHVCVFFAYGGGNITALDPYIGQPVTRSMAEWQKLLCFNQIWIGELAPPPAAPLLQPDADSVYVWHSLKHIFGDMPLHPDWGIDQSWLRAKQLHGLEFGPPTEQELDTPTDRRRMFLYARATWDKVSHRVVWYHAGGHTEY